MKYLFFTLFTGLLGQAWAQVQTPQFSTFEPVSPHQSYYKPVVRNQRVMPMSRHKPAFNPNPNKPLPPEVQADIDKLVQEQEWYKYQLQYQYKANELVGMAKGKQAYSLKKAAFLVENAFYNGESDYK